jgi:hypothetical protein
MSATLDGMARKKAGEKSAEELAARELAARELVRLAQVVWIERHLS